MMICPVNPVDGAVAVPPGRSSIQSRAHPSFAVVSRQAGRQAYVYGGEKEQDDGTWLRLDENLDSQLLPC